MVAFSRQANCKLRKFKRMVELRYSKTRSRMYPPLHATCLWRKAKQSAIQHILFNIDSLIDKTINLLFSGFPVWLL